MLSAADNADNADNPPAGENSRMTVRSRAPWRRAARYVHLVSLLPEEPDRQPGSARMTPTLSRRGRGSGRLASVVIGRRTTLDASSSLAGRRDQGRQPCGMS